MADKATFNDKSVSQNRRLFLALVVQLAILCIYISRIVYDSATVKIVSFHRRFLVVAFFVVRAEFQAAVKCCLES